MIKKNILVFPCGSEVGLELHKSLSHSIHFELYGGSSVGDHGEFVYENYIADLPMISDDNFIEKLNEVIKAHQIDMIFPAHDSVVLALAQASVAGTLACTVLTSPLETCEVARSKKLTYETLSDVVAIPRLYDGPEVVKASDLPLFLKPDVGQGSKGTAKLDDLDDLAFYLKHDPTLLIMEYLPGKEYTIDCFTNKNGELLVAEGRQRRRISNGISVSSTTVNDDRFKQIAEAINQQLTFRGVWFFQVKERADGELVLMEIAPRIAGTMGLIRCKGVNLALMTLFDALDIPVSVVENDNQIVIDRALENKYKLDIAYQHAYFDYDDLLLVDDVVNPAVVALVYQCIARGIKVYLITRHKGDLNDSLRQHRLTNTFDEVYWLQDPTDEKYNYITQQDAIFIDDSFQERKKVHEQLSIPVFDIHMLECLINKG